MWHSHSRRGKLLWIAPFGLVAIALFIFIGGSVVQGLWNWLTPALFGWREITFWQAVALLALSRILFGGFGRHGGGGGMRMRMRERMTDRMVERMGERVDEMNPEERERIRQRIRDRFGFGPSSEGTKPL